MEVRIEETATHAGPGVKSADDAEDLTESAEDRMIFWGGLER
jgi:hypothetical protein